MQDHDNKSRLFWDSVLRVFGHKHFDLGDQLWDAEWLWHNIILQD
jgi:hypothetical protein